MANEIVTINNARVEIDRNVILDDIHFNVFENDFIGIIGPNGGGKTTLLKLMLGMIVPARGEVRIFGDDPALLRKGIGYVPQVSYFDRDFPVNVLEVVMMGRLSERRVLSQYNQEDRELSMNALERVEIQDLYDRPIGKLSGGERQRAFIARALVSRPRLLLLDEPTSSIDPQMRVGVFELLNELKKDMAIILVTHDMGVISSYVDKIACLNRRLFYHNDKKLSKETLEKVYCCPVDLIAHGLPHRVFEEHGHEEGK